MTSCQDCRYLKCYRGTCDRYGVPQEPDYYECEGECTEDELDRFFYGCEEWQDDEDGCQGFELREDFDDEW